MRSWSLYTHELLMQRLISLQSETCRRYVRQFRLDYRIDTYKKISSSGLTSLFRLLIVIDCTYSCGSVAEWLGRWTCDREFESRPLRYRVQPWASC